MGWSKMIPHRCIVRDFDRWFGAGEIDIDESLDLTGASMLEDNALLERSRLVSRQFLSARTITWQHHSGDCTVSSTLTEFSSPAQARLSVEDLHQTLRAAAADIVEHGARLAAVFPEDDDEARITIGSTPYANLQIVIVCEGNAELGAVVGLLAAQVQLLADSMDQFG
jgi:hypothetical protein